MKKYLYEAVVTPNELGGYDVSFPDFDVVTQGEDLADAVFMAQDLLETLISAELALGTAVDEVGTFNTDCPHDGILMGIAITANASLTHERTMTVKEAADVLDVSTSRVHAMINAGILRTQKVGTSRLIFAEDVMNYFNSPRTAGRPKKVLTASA